MSGFTTSNTLRVMIGKFRYKKKRKKKKNGKKKTNLRKS